MHVLPSHPYLMDKLTLRIQQRDLREVNKDEYNIPLCALTHLLLSVEASSLISWCEAKQWLVRIWTIPPMMLFIRLYSSQLCAAPHCLNDSSFSVASLIHLNTSMSVNLQTFMCFSLCCRHRAAALFPTQIHFYTALKLRRERQHKPQKSGRCVCVFFFKPWEYPQLSDSPVKL